MPQQTLLALFWQLPERYEIPRPLRQRGLSAEDIKVPIVCTNFVKGLLGAVPLVENVFDQVLAVKKGIRLSSQ
jgi:hypothetical protein